jgi:intraflagellar transport protein 140
LQVEIDEFRDYEKALSALREAMAYMAKARSQNKDERCKQLQQNIYLVDRFVKARKIVKVRKACLLAPLTPLASITSAITTI